MHKAKTLQQPEDLHARARGSAAAGARLRARSPTRRRRGAAPLPRAPGELPCGGGAAGRPGSAREGRRTSSSSHGFAASLPASDAGIRMSLRCARSSPRTRWKRDAGERSSDGRSWKDEGSAPRMTTSQSSASVAPSRRSSAPPATIAEGNPCALSQHTSIFRSHSASAAPPAPLPAPTAGARGARAIPCRPLHPTVYSRPVLAPSARQPLVTKSNFAAKKFSRTNHLCTSAARAAGAGMPPFSRRGSGGTTVTVTLGGGGGGGGGLISKKKATAGGVRGGACARLRRAPRSHTALCAPPARGAARRVRRRSRAHRGRRARTSGAACAQAGLMSASMKKAVGVSSLGGRLGKKLNGNDLRLRLGGGGGGGGGGPVQLQSKATKVTFQQQEDGDR